MVVPSERSCQNKTNVKYQSSDMHFSNSKPNSKVKVTGLMLVTWLVTRNTHLKYQSSSTHYSKVNSKFKVFFLKGQGHRVKNVGTLRKVLFVCLFAWSLSSHLRIFYSYGDVTIAGEWLQIWTYARHS